MTDRTDGTLFRYTKETYEGSFHEDVLEQYKLYVQSAENVSARRVASSRYLLTLSVALVALYGFQSSHFDPGGWAMLVPVLGALVLVLWHRIIKSHRDLNAVKFEIVHAIEQRLPAALYAHEWRLAEEGKASPIAPWPTSSAGFPWPFSACTSFSSSFSQGTRCRLGAHNGLHPADSSGCSHRTVQVDPSQRVNRCRLLK